MPKIKVKSQTVQTGECPLQTDTHAHTRTNGWTRTHTDATKRIISPCYAVDKYAIIYGVAYQPSALGCWSTGLNCCVRRSLEVRQCRWSLSSVCCLADVHQKWVRSRPRGHRREVALTYLLCWHTRAAGRTSGPLLFSFLNLVTLSTSNEACLVCAVILVLIVIIHNSYQFNRYIQSHTHTHLNHVNWRYTTKNLP